MSSVVDNFQYRRTPYCPVSVNTAELDTPATDAVIVTVPSTGGSIYVWLNVPLVPVVPGLAPKLPPVPPSSKHPRARHRISILIGHQHRERLRQRRPGRSRLVISARGGNRRRRSRDRELHKACVLQTRRAGGHRIFTVVGNRKDVAARPLALVVARLGSACRHDWK